MAASPGLLRLWIVEDSRSYRDTMVQLLQHTDGISCVVPFASGEEALAAAVPTAERPDVVLMDISLPGVSGLETTARLKATWPLVEIVMLTNHDEPDTIFGALRSGASGYLLKNTPVDRIFAAVSQAGQGAMLLPAPVARRVLGFFVEQDGQAAMVPAADYGLSERERDVLGEMIEGKTQKEIAASLFISPSTVNSHTQRIYKKLHVNSASAAVAVAVRESLV